MEWIPVDQALPRDTRRILFTWRNRQGKWRTALGLYVRHREIEADWDVSNEECEEDANGTSWLMEGWYEDSYTAGYVGLVLDVTHWMPLPASPDHPASTA